MAVTKPAQSPELGVPGTEGDIHYLRVYIRHGPGVHEEIKAVLGFRWKLRKWRLREWK